MKLRDLDGNTALLVCGHVFRRERELRLVSFDHDGPQATCDLDHGNEDAEKDAKLIALERIFSWEPWLEFLRELQVGQQAWKSGPDSWTIEDIGENP